MASRFLKSNKFHCVKNPKIIWPKEITKGSIFAHGNQTLNIFLILNLLCDMPLKTKPEDQLTQIQLVVDVYLFRKLAELTLFWFCFNCVDFWHILLSKYLTLHNLTLKTFAWKYTVSSNNLFSENSNPFSVNFKMTLPQASERKETYFVVSKIL